MSFEPRRATIMTFSPSPRRLLVLAACLLAFGGCTRGRHPDSRVEAGQSAVKAGRLAEARGIFRQALERRPKDDQLVDQVVEVWVEAGRAMEAADFLKQAAETTLRTDRYFAAASLYQTLGNLEAAEQMYRETLRRQPGHQEALNNLAYLYAEAGRNLPEALKLANRALAGPLDQPHIVDTRAWVYYRLAQLQAASPSQRLAWLYHARDDAEAAVDGDPRTAELRYHLGVISLAQGDWNRAKVELTKALWLRPSLREASVALERLRQIARQRAAAASRLS